MSMKPHRNPRLSASALALLLLLATPCVAPISASADPTAKRVFIDERCDRCHGVEAVGVVAKKPRASDLSQMGAKEADWIREYLLRKRELAGKTHPVAWKGSDGDLEVLVSWLASLEPDGSE